MAKQQMPGVVYKELTPEDLKDPFLTALNEYLRELAIMANIIAGTHGPIPFTVDINMQENNLKDVGFLSVSGPAPAVPAGELALGSGTAATATAGAATLPANPLGFLIMYLGGVGLVKVPYYKP